MMDYSHASRLCGQAADDAARIRSRASGRLEPRHGRAAAAEGGRPKSDLGDRSVRCSVDGAANRNARLLCEAGSVPFRHTLFAAAYPAKARAAHPAAERGAADDKAAHCSSRIHTSRPATLQLSLALDHIARSISLVRAAVGCQRTGDGYAAAVARRTYGSPHTFGAGSNSHSATSSV
jgi:hypothetical protein